jgi:hypothetical protein
VRPVRTSTAGLPLLPPRLAVDRRRQLLDVAPTHFQDHGARHYWLLPAFGEVPRYLGVQLVQIVTDGRDTSSCGLMRTPWGGA